MGIFVGVDEKVLKLIKQCSMQNQTSRINFAYFVDHLKKRLTNPPSSIALIKALQDLELKNLVSLEKQNGKVRTIIYPGFFIERIEEIYSQMCGDLGMPFPTDTTFKEPVPDSIVKKVNVKSEFVSYLENPEQSGKPLLKLVFPNFDYPLLTLPRFLKKTLLISAIEKIKFYLSREQNLDYIRTRMMSAFKGEESAVKIILANLSKSADIVAQTIINPDAFSFKFWTHIASSIVKEYQAQKTAVGDDFMAAQAAYLIGFYNVYYKGISQREQSLEVSLENLDKLLNREPYIFTVRDMYNFKDPKDEIEIIKKIGKDVFNKHLSELTKKQENENLPRLISIKIERNKEVFILRDVFILYFLRMVSQTEPLLKASIYEDWKDAFETYTRLGEMKSDEAFKKVVNSKVKAINPTLYSFLDYKLLNSFRTSDKLKEREKSELNLFFDDGSGQLKSLDRIFNLNRRDVLNEVKASLPLTKSSSFVRAIVVFFAKALGLFSTMKERKNKDDSLSKNIDMEFTKTSNTDYVNAINNLKEAFLGEGSDDEKIEYTLEELIEKWNPLIDNIAKENLIEDVNSMIRDYVRKLRRSFVVSAPTKDRVESMAMRLSRNNAFSGIKNKDALQRYIEIYMIKILSSLKLMK